MTTDFISAAVAAAMNVENKLTVSQQPALSSEPTAEPSATTAPPTSTPDLSNNTNSDKQSLSKPKKKRTRSHLTPGSNWEKLKTTLHSETAGRRPAAVRKKKRALAKRPRSAAAAVAPPDDVVAKQGCADDVARSQFVRGAVSARDGEPTHVIALDCEMVEMAGGRDALARVSVVNVRGDVVYDTFVAADGEVADYRFEHSGVRAQDVADGADPNEVRAKVADLLKGRILVGHALKNDLRALALAHPRGLTRDTSLYFRHRLGRRGGAPKLAALVAAKLGVDQFQKGHHNSVEDARAALALYKKFAADWEKELREQAAARPRAKKNRKGSRNRAMHA